MAKKYSNKLLNKEKLKLKNKKHKKNSKIIIINKKNNEFINYF
jgi:hypothetical protein